MRVCRAGGGCVAGVVGGVGPPIPITAITGPGNGLAGCLCWARRLAGRLGWLCVVPAGGAFVRCRGCGGAFDAVWWRCV